MTIDAEEADMAKKKPAAQFQPCPDRPAELPSDDFQLMLQEAVEKLKTPRVRNAGRNAIAHIKKAWVLHPVDSEMSAFRAITAEEEAATAVIRALRFQKYPNAEKLNDRSHPHKSSIWPFILAVANKMDEKNIAEPKMSLRLDGEPRIELSIDIGSQAGLVQSLWASPDEPFNFSMSSDRTGPFKIHDFSEELSEIASSSGARNIMEYVAAEANRRNQLLYASDQGIPSVEFEDSFLLRRRQRVTTLLALTIAIMQTKTHQLFLVQCLDALLRALQRFDGEPPSFPEADPKSARIELAEQADGTMDLFFIEPDG